MSQKERERLKVLHGVKSGKSRKCKRGKSWDLLRAGCGSAAADESAGRPGGGARVAGNTGSCRNAFGKECKDVVNSP
jgi:hypothetical protein